MDKKISLIDVVAMMQLPKIGRKTALKLINSLNHKISGRQDLIDYLKEKASGHKLPDYSPSDMEDAFKEAEDILIQSEKAGIKIISYQDQQYPKQLLDTKDFPVTLSYKGNIDVLSDKPNIAVIGTREPSEYGSRVGERMGELFASLQFNVVSGLAAGCDTAGHVGALRGKGSTTAVLAHGVDYIYPKENKELAEQILDNDGLLISEYFVKQRPLSNFFVERDRIQAGLSQSVVIVETDVNGGTMHTARYCKEYNRKLVCFNHPIEYRSHVKAQGNQKLIKEGAATPVTSKDEMDMLAFIVLDDFLESKDHFFAKRTFYDTIGRHFIKQKVNDFFFNGKDIQIPETELYGIIYKNLFSEISSHLSWNFENSPNLHYDHFQSLNVFEINLGGEKRKIYSDFLKDIYDNLSVISASLNDSNSLNQQEQGPSKPPTAQKSKSAKKAKRKKNDNNYKIWEE